MFSENALKYFLWGILSQIILLKGSGYAICCDLNFFKKNILS